MADFDPVIAAALGWALFLLLIGGLMTPRGDWYERLNKPSWQPPGWAFGPAWTTILGLAGWSGVIAWRATSDPGDHQAIIVLFAVNGVFHFLWSPLFFRSQRPDWALAEVPFLWGSIFALVVGLAPIAPTAALMNLPYLAWVSFAAYLNWTIVRLNPRRA